MKINILGFLLLGISPHLIASLSVNHSPGNFVSPTAELDLSFSSIPFPGNTVTNYSFGLTPSNEYIGQMGGSYVFRSSENPDVNTVIDSTSFRYFYTQSAGPDLYDNGAQAGDDNWIYITNINDEVAWAQVDIQENVVTPVKYVWDPANRTAPIILSDAVVAIPEPSSVAIVFLGTLVLFRLRRRLATYFR